MPWFVKFVSGNKWLIQVDTHDMKVEFGNVFLILSDDWKIAAMLVTGQPLPTVRDHKEVIRFQDLKRFFLHVTVDTKDLRMEFGRMCHAGTPTEL